MLQVGPFKAVPPSMLANGRDSDPQDPPTSSAETAGRGQREPSRRWVHGSVLRLPFGPPGIASTSTMMISMLMAMWSGWWGNCN